MKRILLFALATGMVFALAACGGQQMESGELQSSAAVSNAVDSESGSLETKPEESISTQEQPVSTPEPETEEPKEERTMSEEITIKITVGDTELTATLEDNATTQALLEQMPMTLSMQDLYGREMCYHYGAGALPTGTLRSDGYAVGDIAYWPPRGSLVILYAQNGEQFERQQIGHISEGVEIFETTGDADVTFEQVKD